MSDAEKPVSQSDTDRPKVINQISRPLVQPSRKVLDAAHLARVIVWTFAASVGCSFLVSFFLVLSPSKCTIPKGGNEEAIECVIDLNPAFELFKTTSSIMAGPLGFVLGFYFREVSSDK